MNVLLLIATLSLPAQSLESYLPKNTSEGSLVFILNGSFVVRSYTNMPETHSMILLKDHGKLIVYECRPPCIHKLEPSQYVYKIKDRETLILCVPKKPYIDKELASMHKYAEAVLGEKFNIRGYFRDNDVFGQHCTEFTTNVLLSSGRYTLQSLNVEAAYKMQPGMLRQKLSSTYNMYVIKRGIKCKDDNF